MTTGWFLTSLSLVLAISLTSSIAAVADPSELSDAVAANLSLDLELAVLVKTNESPSPADPQFRPSLLALAEEFKALSVALETKSIDEQMAIYDRVWEHIQELRHMPDLESLAISETEAEAFLSSLNALGEHLAVRR